MHDEPIQLPPDERDENVQGAVLMHLLHAYPAQLTATELLHELTETPNDFGSRDRIQRATRDLVAVGLLHRNGEFVVPSRAAVHFHELPS